MPLRLTGRQLNILENGPYLATANEVVHVTGERGKEERTAGVMLNITHKPTGKAFQTVYMAGDPLDPPKVGEIQYERLAVGQDGKKVTETVTEEQPKFTKADMEGAFAHLKEVWTDEPIS